jgi:hypothetical protein
VCLQEQTEHTKQRFKLMAEMQELSHSVQDFVVRVRKIKVAFIKQQEGLAVRAQKQQQQQESLTTLLSQLGMMIDM